MRAGFNPTRRNRNIGTAKQGHGSNNCMQIPTICHNERAWWATVSNYKIVHRRVSGRDIEFVVETTRGNYIHTCTVSDICHVLSAIPQQDWDGLHGFVLRQSTRKERIIDPSWGRLAYTANVGKPGKPDVYSGPALILEATDPTQTLTWDKSLSPDATRELERLKEDGHKVEEGKKHYMIMGNASSIRVTQLYRTMLHEIGHWLDWQERVLRPADTMPSRSEQLEDMYFARPRTEREAFAHRYATRLRKQLWDRGVLPFNQIKDED